MDAKSRLMEERRDRVQIGNTLTVGRDTTQQTGEIINRKGQRKSEIHTHTHMGGEAFLGMDGG